MIPLVAPSYDQSDIDAVTAAAEQGFFANGEVSRQFEDAVASRFGLQGGVATTSGTSALQLALLALGVGKGDEVIAPSYTCVAVLNAIRLAGADCVLVDIDVAPSAMAYNIDLELAGAAITARTKSVIVPHAFGVPCDVRPLLDLDVCVIEDVAMSFGSCLPDGTPAGSHGHVTVSSFHESKVISAGTAGMALARDPTVVAAMRHFNNDTGAQARDRVVDADSLYGSYELRLGHRPSDLEAALGLSQLRRLSDFIARRRLIAEFYEGEFASVAITPSALPHGAFPFRYQLWIARSPATIIASLALQDIEAGRGVYPPLHVLLGRNGWGESETERATAHALSVPLHPSMTDTDVERTAAAVRRELT